MSERWVEERARLLDVDPVAVAAANCCGDNALREITRPCIDGLLVERVKPTPAVPDLGRFLGPRPTLAEPTSRMKSRTLVQRDD